MPRGAVYRARPSHPGVPVGNHEWEPREAPTLHREPNGQRLHFPPRPLGVTAAARLSRRGRHREQRARVPGSSRTEPAASARPCVAFTLRCPAVLGGGPHTSLHPPGLWKLPPNRLAVNKLSPLWRRSTSSRPPRDRRRRRHTPPSAPPGEAVRPPRLCRTSARSPSTAGCPSARATALMPFFSGGRSGRRTGSGCRSPYARAAEPERLWYGSRGVSSLLPQARLTPRSSPTHPAGAPQPPISSLRCVRPGGSA